jgi:hypothetical protein
VTEVVSDPKGNVVALPGQAFLRVVFHPSSGYQTYTDPSSITPRFPAVLQVRAAGLCAIGRPIPFAPSIAETRSGLRCAYFTGSR